MSSRMEAKRLDIIESIVSHVEETLKQWEFESGDASRIAVSVADNLVDIFGGQNFTIPMNYRKKLAEKEASIFKQFDGNVAALAIQYQMTERGMRKLLDRARARKVQGGKV